MQTGHGKDVNLPFAAASRRLSYSFYMSTWQPPQTTSIVDLSFMDARFKLIDLAAFLDRVQRAGQDDDYRVVALKKAITCLSQNDPERAKQVLLTFSDPTEEPIAKATTQGAAGAYKKG